MNKLSKMIFDKYFKELVFVALLSGGIACRKYEQKPTEIHKATFVLEKLITNQR